MKVRELKAELAKASDNAEVVVSLDNEDIKKIVKLAKGITSDTIMITDPAPEDAGVIVIGSKGIRPFEEIFTVSVKKAVKKVKWMKWIWLE